MALDPRIILAGQPVNALGALMTSDAGAQQAYGFDRQKQMDAMLAENGAGIIAGDQNALNALAGYDPSAAMGVQQTRLGMDATRLDMDAQRQKMAMLNREEQRAIAAQAASLSAAEREATAKQIEDAVKMGMMARNPQEFDAIMTQLGATDLVGQFDNRQMLAARAMGMAEVFKMAFPEPMNPSDQFKVVGTQLWDLGADGGPVKVGEAPGTSKTVYGPDGNPVYTEGPANPNGVKLTEGQSKDVGFYGRILGASKNLDAYEGALTSLKDTAAAGIPMIGNYMVSEEFQLGQQAAKEWLAPVLRKDTGAAVTDGEMAMYGPMYLPMPGDGPEVIAQKREARKRAEEGLRDGMGTAEIVAAEIARRNGTAAKPTSEMSDEELLNLYGAD